MSTFTEIRDGLVKLGLPLLGAALPIPGGAALGAALANSLGKQKATPGELLQELTSNPEALQKAKEFEATHAEVMLRLTVDAEIAVNKTMQVEAASEHWPTYSWRPFIGFQLGLYILAQWMLPLFKIPAPVVDAQLMLVIGGILGVASFFRGKAQADPNIVTTNKG